MVSYKYKAFSAPGKKNRADRKIFSIAVAEKLWKEETWTFTKV